MSAIDSVGSSGYDYSAITSLTSKLIAKNDTNGDGVLSQSELDGMNAETFSSIDTDSDGVLNTDELNVAKANLTERLFGGLDTNGDGILSEAELNAGAANMFSTVDTNDDSQVSRDELMYYAGPSGFMTQSAIPATTGSNVNMTA